VSSCLSQSILYVSINNFNISLFSCFLLLSLPDHVVDVNSLKQFETRLDKFWRDQDVMFDWTAEITGTGDRSEFKLETVLESNV